MTTIRIRATGEVMSEGQYRAQRPQTSFPAVINWDNEECDVVFPAPAPAFNPLTQYAREIAPSLSVKGTWQQNYEILDMDAETIAAKQLQMDEQDNARIKAELAALDLLSIRGLREYVAAQTNAPQHVKDKEVEAQTKRSALK